MNTNTTKIALITGGSRGLGKSAALHLGRRGIDIILTYRSQAEEAQAVVAELHAMGRKAVAIGLDMGAIDTYSTFASALESQLQDVWQSKQIDYVVNNAGMGVHVSFVDTTEAQFDELMNVHLKGVFFFTQKLLPFIANGGSILNVSSGLTRFALPGYSAYALMKGGVEVLSRYMAKELGARGIRVNVLAPGAIETDFGHGAVRDNVQLNQFVAQQTALGRAGLPDDIGRVVAALLSSESGWINGQRIEASGGMFL